ncbi:MAG: signal peptide peptidase SppA [Candidatus Nitronauta litoralis]|uniref:Signal peptide peptidase SppA n=1 Tax=Candidatus Nitronauta litoralis TaxID=2705533 RepID=A0A7T0BYE4_9BACT|nr:MAG: signal peptide peptidase SppA [Candidatus Nitronauta litoralis]
MIFNEKNILKIILSILLCAFLAGCSLVKLNFGSSISPLEEKVISGEGDAKVLILNIEGFISNQKKRTLMGSQSDVGMVERVRETLQKATEEEDIQALVLKINTPGGTVTSSDIIYHELKRFKEDRKIPVYAWVVDLAASGGYYIAQAADKILAHPTSITGSIGVITVKVNLQGLMDKVGVDWEVIKSGEKKDFLSPFRAITAEERKLFQETIDHFYKRFVKIIAENRKNLTEDQVKSLADGQVFSSEKALNNNLIDQIAYRDEAIELIKKDLGVDKIKLVTYRRSGEYKSNLYSSISGQPVINLVNLNLNFLPENPGPHFFYLWMP